MKRFSVIAVVLLMFMALHVPATDYEIASFTEDGVHVDVQITADTPWFSPIIGTVDLNLGVVPLAENVIAVNVTQVIVTVHRKDTSGVGYSLVGAESVEISPAAHGTAHANISETLFISVSQSGAECYFAVSLTGLYSNGTHVSMFSIISPEDIVGPFIISDGLFSPKVIVGIAISVVSVIVIVAGVRLARKNQGQRKRKRLLED